MYQIRTPAQHACLPVVLCAAAFSVSLSAEENPFAGSKQISTRELVQAVLSQNPSGVGRGRGAYNRRGKPNSLE